MAKGWNAKKPQMEDVILDYPPLRDRIKLRPADAAKVLKNIKEIAANFSHSAIESFEKILDVAIPTVYDGIHFTLPEGLDFKQFTKDNNVVLVPNHQSHADYIALNYMVYKRFKIPVFIAGGINLDIFPIGTLFRRSGCFFIRRSFNNDIIYKLTLEAYLHFLLGTGSPIEFFFEGGRSRTGKLLPPRFGLFTMLMEAHQHLPENIKKEIVFLPVSIVHEYVPEQKSLAREMTGGKKTKESTQQLLKIFKLWRYQLGNIHIHASLPVRPDPSYADPREQIQHLAFDCFRAVGAQMRITPTALLSTVLLEEPEGAMTWNEIIQKARRIVEFAQRYRVAHTESLAPLQFEESMARALDILVGNRKVERIGQTGMGQPFYSIRKDSRMELMYFKNTILHHFLVPWIINTAWIGLFTGKINNVNDLIKHFLTQRQQLKFEFYLPTVKQFLHQSLEIISGSVGREVSSLGECLELSHKELYQLASSISVFSRGCSYIMEGYFIGALTIKALYVESKEGFRTEAYIKKSKDVFEVERSLGRVIRYPESYTVPVIKNALDYFSHLKLLDIAQGIYKVSSPEKLDTLIERYQNDLMEQMRFNLRL